MRYLAQFWLVAERSFAPCFRGGIEVEFKCKGEICEAGSPLPVQDTPRAHQAHFGCGCGLLADGTRIVASCAEVCGLLPVSCCEEVPPAPTGMVASEVCHLGVHEGVKGSLVAWMACKSGCVVRRLLVALPFEEHLSSMCRSEAEGCKPPEHCVPRTASETPTMSRWISCARIRGRTVGVHCQLMPTCPLSLLLPSLLSSSPQQCADEALVTFLVGLRTQLVLTFVCAVWC